MTGWAIYAIVMLVVLALVSTIGIKGLMGSGMNKRPIPTKEDELNARLGR